MSNVYRTGKMNARLLFAAVSLAALALPARASTNYVTNGDFSLSTSGNGQLGFNTNATSWTNNQDGQGHDGYNFIYAPGTADGSGATGVSGVVKLWGPADGSANGLTASSPDGGNYIAADGAYQIGSITQQISGLTVGLQYTLSYWWAGAQQSTFNGQTTEQWIASVGDLTQNSPVLTNPTNGFTGWKKQTFTFIADNASPLLSFLAVGTPVGEPPFSLLDGVSLTQTPEPATSALIGLGLLAIPFATRLLRKRR